MRRVVVAGLLALVLIPVAGAAADAPSPEALLAGMKRWLEPSHSSTRQLTMIMRSTPGETVEWKAGQARAQLADGNWVLTVVLEPKDARGSAVLIRENAGKPDAQWMYIPFLRRVRKILPVNEFDSFLGTDFTYSDLGFVSVRDRAVALLGTEKVGGTDAYKVQETPDRVTYFSRIVTWMTKDAQRPLRREYYDVAGALWKVETFGEAVVIEGLPTLLGVTMEDKQAGYSSSYRVSHVDYDAEVPSQLFDWQRLPLAAEHPIWSKK